MKKQLLIIIPTLIVGGAEKTLLNFLNLLDYNRVEVHLVVLLKYGKFINEVPSQVKLSFLTKNRWLDKAVRFLYIKFDSLYFLKYYAKKIKGKYDLGLCYLDSFASEYLIHCTAKIEIKATLIQSSYKSWKLVNNSLSNKGKQKRLKRYQNMDYILAVSEDSLNEFKELHGEINKMAVFKNPINSKKIRILSKKTQEIVFEHDKINIVALGRLIEVKGYDLLIEAAKNVKEHVDNFKIYIIGTGELADNLNSLITKHGLQDNVVLTGFIENPYSLIDQADFFVMTSRSEGLPTSLCEAMILGKPVITTNVPGCREVVDYGKWGLCVEPNPDDIALGLNKMIQDNTLRERYEKKSIERAIIYEDKIIMENYYKLIEQND